MAEFTQMINSRRQEDDWLRTCASRLPGGLGLAVLREPHAPVHGMCVHGGGCVCVCGVCVCVRVCVCVCVCVGGRGEFSLAPVSKYNCVNCVLLINTPNLFADLSSA